MIEKFVRAEIDGHVRHARWLGDRLHLLDAPPWDAGQETGEDRAVAEARLLCPVSPSKIIGLGRNYAAHAKELGNETPSVPLIFQKPPSALLAPGEPLVLPRASSRVEYEGELAFVIGKPARKVPAERALEYVFGLTIACDVTARDLQMIDDQWTRAKGFDSFCPLAAHVTSGVSPSDLELCTHVNGALRQSARTSEMVFDVSRQIEFISGVMTLLPGDLVLTGTPEGVGPLSAGDRVRIEISELGRLEFDIVADDN